MSESDLQSPIEVLVYCDACLNPLVYKIRDTDDIFARFYIHTVTQNFCACCAPHLGYLVSNRFLDRNRTQTISRN